MATSPIVGGALDVSTIVSQLMTIERQPISKLELKEGVAKSKLTAWSRLQGALSSIQTAAETLGKSTSFGGRSVSVSGDLVQASAADSAGLGRYLVGVERLARAQSVASSPQGASTDLAGAGRLTLTLGSYDGDTNAFTAGSAAPVSVDIDADDTLADLRDKINAANAGVTAGLVTDSNGVRLTLMSSDTGAAKGFKLTVDENANGAADPGDLDATGLSRFAFDPTATAYDALVPGSGGRNMAQTQAATDAKLTVNGLTLYSASNTVTTAIEGVTLSLRKEAAAGTVSEVAVERNTTRTKEAVAAFVKAYNDFESLAKELTKFDNTAKTAAALNGDSAVRSVQSQVRQSMRTALAAAGGEYTALTEVGIEFQKDGTLKVNDSKLADALAADASKVSRLFTTTGATSAEQGFGVRLGTLVKAMIGSGGSVEARQKGIQADIDRINDRQTLMEARLELVEARLRKQYAALDALVTGNQSQANALANALAAIPLSGVGT